jgi:hypothetical protein
MISFAVLSFHSRCLSMCSIPFGDPLLKNKNNPKWAMNYFDLFFAENGFKIIRRRCLIFVAVALPCSVLFLLDP